MKRLISLKAGLLILCFYFSGSIKAQAVKFDRVVVLGNSMLFHGADSSLGWYGNWGMAASSIDSDYLHILKRFLNTKNANTDVHFMNVVRFERNYKIDDLNEFDSLVKLKPDLLILKFGENIKSDSLKVDTFYLAFQTMISKFKSANPNLTILCFGTFWKNETVNKVLELSCQRLGIHFTNISNLSTAENEALNSYKNKGVGMHPNNMGMAEIANSIIREINSYKVSH